MALSGRLTDTGLPGLLQVLAQAQKSGKLTITSREAQGIVVLRQGKMVYAATSSVRETLGNILVSKRLISDETLSEALNRQFSSPSPVHLGNVLESMGAVTAQQLQEVLEEQALRVLGELVGWQDGFFKFDTIEIEEPGTLTVDLADYLMEEGLQVEIALLNLAAYEAPIDEGQPGAATAENAVSLRELIKQVRQPTLNAELAREILDFASRFVDRAILFLSQGEHFQGVAGIGDGVDSGVRDLAIPKLAASLLASAYEHQRSIELSSTDASGDALLQQLEGRAPQHCIAIPMTIGNKVSIVLYADRLDGRIEAAAWLEALVSQTGMAMERAYLEQKIRDLTEELDSKGKIKSSAGTGDQFSNSSQRIADLLSGKISGH